ncbi:LOW QUALITY PROTEIN: hypothetical protein PanWU01x14_056910 [Parasponia andersonii]|uniref:Uncharacterized protein n=1 Tax=Parasponia andersonii TaxID=3476 RepID=A0A2P5DJN3_PARAD|nr:LOW QUALITY PROTEIN: hypothetical protein PanWU01x14_056910 [Parasponia andersonii]
MSYYHPCKHYYRTIDKLKTNLYANTCVYLCLLYQIYLHLFNLHYLPRATNASLQEPRPCVFLRDYSTSNVDCLDSVRFIYLLMFMIKVSEYSGIEQSNRVARFLLSIFSLIAAS